MGVYPDGSPSGGDVWIGTATEEARPTPGSNDAHTFCMNWPRAWLEASPLRRPGQP